MENSDSKLALIYGDSTRGSVSFTGQVRVENASSRDLAELDQAVSAALKTPLDFPSVELAIVPGDRVVVAIDPAVPRMAEVVKEIIDYLGRQGTSPAQVTVVLARHAQVDVDELTRRLPEEVVVELHDPDDPAKVAYVAANKEGEPIYMNRSLVDADFVLPVMCARSRHAIDYEGAYGLFPFLTDRRTRGRFFSLRQLADPSEHSRLTAWADEAAWWVGLLVAVQVIPTKDGGVAGVLAGSPQTLEIAVQSAMDETWPSSIEDTYACVLALIDGGPSQQSWDSVARVLAAAGPLIKPDGALIICTELSQQPGVALRKLNNPNRSDDGLARQLSKESSDDALAAALLLELLDSNHVYLMSKLSGEVVEGLGMGAIENLNEAEHIIHQYQSCLVIGSAQHRILLNPEASLQSTDAQRPHRGRQKPDQVS